MHPFVPLDFHENPLPEILERAARFHTEMSRRRTTRHFSSRPVPRTAIEFALRTAGTAPSGAHQQPWTFVAISEPELKRQIREAAESEEREFYSGRAPRDWLEALAPLGTDENKPHLTVAPWLVVVFRKAYGVAADGTRRTYYYTSESVGIAVGLLIASIHHMGLVALTHTPSPMGFLQELLRRPSNERAYLILAIGYPEAGAQVPDIRRKPLEEIAVFLDAESPVKEARGESPTPQSDGGRQEGPADSGA